MIPQKKNKNFHLYKTTPSPKSTKHRNHPTIGAYTKWRTKHGLTEVITMEWFVGKLHGSR